jgi:hypothetical protein
MRGARSSEPGPWLLLLLLVAAAWPVAAQVPRFETDGGGMTWLRDLPPLLLQPEVRKKLDTGLTTSFEFKLEGGGEQRVFALFDVRFEPWDEVYEVTWVDRRGRFEKLTVPSFEQLADYWRGLRLAAGNLPPASGARSEKLRLLVELVPFSQREQDETQRWFSDSLSQAGQGTAEGAAGSGKDSPEALGQALSVLMATSIERRSVFSYRFVVPAPVVLAGSQ